MRILWLCNVVPGAVYLSQGLWSKSGMWLDQVVSGIQQKNEITLRMLCRNTAESEGEVCERISYRCFSEPVPYRYYPELEKLFSKEIENFHPDVIHIWGTEYGHSLAMMNAAEKLGVNNRAVISIQGLCSVIAQHYCDGIPAWAKFGCSLRDFLRWDNLYLQQKKFYRRGKMEIQALQKTSHVIGRTHWDRACTEKYNPKCRYHFCNETLREAFFYGGWAYGNCTPYRIFVSGCSYPIKGFHILLKAMCRVLKDYPQTTITVTGNDFRTHGKNRLYAQSYQLYLEHLTKKYGLQDRITFLGTLTEYGMREGMENANVFVLPSLIENSPNSLGEAMLLGTPCVAADVGGVTTMLHAPEEGLIFPAGDADALAQSIMEVFSRGAEATSMGHQASLHAHKTHDPAVNLQTLLDIYDTIASGCEE